MWLWSPPGCASLPRWLFCAVIFPMLWSRVQARKEPGISRGGRHKGWYRWHSRLPPPACTGPKRRCPRGGWTGKTSVASAVMISRCSGAKAWLLFTAVAIAVLSPFNRIMICVVVARQESELPQMIRLVRDRKSSCLYRTLLEHRPRSAQVNHLLLKNYFA